ncbi:hypothetical protein C0J45_15991 [Silurus meridionalis]|nr:hypothetical protein C0J45_15991 [Silurus meridionalis]
MGCFRSGGDVETLGPLSAEDGEGNVAGLLSCTDGDAASHLSSGDDCDGLGLLSVSNGGVVEQDDMVPRPFTCFSWFLQDAGDARVDFSDEEGEKDVEDEEEIESDDPAMDAVELTLICAASDRLKHGIFSKLTTDFNGHVGEGNRGDEKVMGTYGLKERNVEGQMVVDFAKSMEMAVVNTYFKKKEDHRVTYKCGGRCTQVDYVLCRRCNLKELGDCKVLAGESVARQHRMVVCRMVLVAKKKRRRVRTDRRIRWWKLKEEECNVRFREEVLDDWEITAGVMREAAKKVLGVTSGNRKEDKETWWNEEVQESIIGKRLTKQKWNRQSDEKSRQEYKEMRQQVKRDVAKAKEKAHEELYERLDTKEGEKDLYRLARQRDRAGKDVLQVRAIKDGDGNVLTGEESVFEQLIKTENERERRLDDVELVKQEVDRISKEEMRAVIKRMKSGKSVGPDDIPVEALRCLGEMAV